MKSSPQCLLTSSLCRIENEEIRLRETGTGFGGFISTDQVNLAEDPVCRVLQYLL